MRGRPLANAGGDGERVTQGSPEPGRAGACRRDLLRDDLQAHDLARGDTRERAQLPWRGERGALVAGVHEQGLKASLRQDGGAQRLVVQGGAMRQPWRNLKRAWL